MRRARLVLGALLGLLLLFLLLLHTPPARRFALRQAVVILERQGVQLGAAELRYNLLNLTVTLVNLTVSSRQSSDLPALLQADQVKVDLGLAGIEDAVITNPRLHVVVEKDGRDIPDTFLMTADYPSEFSIFLVSTLTNDAGIPDRIYGRFGTMELGGQRVDLAAIRQSFLAIAADGDHIVPLAATNMQTDLVSSTDKEFLILPGGHVGLAAGRGARKTLWPHVAAWLAVRSARERVAYGVAAD